MSDEKRVKQSLVEGLGGKINIHLLRIEKLNSEKEQKESEINERIKRAGRNYERTDSEILKQQAKKEERLAKEELTKTAQEYDTKIAEEQAKIKALVQEQKKRIEEERKNAEDKMKSLHSDIKSWSEDETTKKRLKARQSIATSIAALKELLDVETDTEARSALEQQIEALKLNISKGSYTASENDTNLTEFKELSKESNEYYKKLSESLEKLDELEELQSQLEDMGIETEDKDYSQENSESWNKFAIKYNKYIKQIVKPLLSSSEKSEFKIKIDSKVRELKSNIDDSNGNIDYTAKIEELNSEFDTYYKNLNTIKKQEVKEKLENATGKLSATPNLADDLRSEFEGKITALNTEDLLMLEDAKNISSDMDKKIKELEDRQNPTYPQEIIDAFEKFDKLCDEVKSEFEKQENVDTERNVYERDFETQRIDWKKAIDNKEEIDVKEIQGKYEDLDKRLTVYKENLKNFKLVEDASIEKIGQAKTDELKKRAGEELQDIIVDKLDEVISIIEKFDGTPIDVSELLKIIEEYIIPGQIDLDPPVQFSDEEKAKREEAHDRAAKANEEFQKNDKITPEDKKDAMDNMAILDIELYDLTVSTADYVKECEEFINEINRIKEEQTKPNPGNNKGPAIYEIESIRVNAKTGVYEFIFTNNDVLRIDTKALYERETDTTKDWTKEYAGRSEKREVWKKWNDDKENQANTPEPEKGLLIKGENMLELRHMIGQLINQKGFFENSQGTTAGSSGKVNSEVAKKLDAKAQRLIDPIIEEVLRLIDEINAQKDKKSQYANQMKYHDALKEQGEETITVEYDVTGLGIKDKHRTNYISKLKKEAKEQGKQNALFKGGKEQDTEEELDEETPKLQYKDLSEPAKRVYNVVVALSKEEKKAKIEEEALRGRITPEDHKQLHEIFDLGPLPVAEKKPNIFKRAFVAVGNVARKTVENVKDFFYRADEEVDDEEKTDDELDRDEQDDNQKQDRNEEGETIREKNNRLINELDNYIKDVLREKLSEAEQNLPNVEEYKRRIEQFKDTISGLVGDTTDFEQRIYEYKTELYKLCNEIIEKRNFNEAIDQVIQDGGLDTLRKECEQNEWIYECFHHERYSILTGTYDEKKLKILKEIIDGKVATGMCEKDTIYSVLELSEEVKNKLEALDNQELGQAK